MAATDLAAPRALTDDDVPAALALSDEAGWNQVADDWRTMLRLGRGFGMSGPEGRLAATSIALPYGPIGWVSMVLVTRSERRKGRATRLVEAAVRHLEDRSIRPVLDATPDGEAVYARKGFGRRRGLTRWQGTVGSGEGLPAGIRLAGPDDLGWIAALDARAFGADRSAVLADLLARPGAPAFAAANRGGFLLGRVGRRATQLGPLSGDSEATAAALLDAALARLSGPVFVDLFDGRTGLADRLARRGFSIQRPFARMLRGGGTLPGDLALSHSAAGPELG